MSDPTPSIVARRRWMAVLARASEADIRAHLKDAPPLPRYTRLRGPETGLVMVRGRAGGDGAPFNFSEMTVTRCAISASGELTGHAYVSGRSHAQAELAAVLDAALQDTAMHPQWMTAVIEPLAQMQAESDAAMMRRAAATRVQFFTLATMR